MKCTELAILTLSLAVAISSAARADSAKCDLESIRKIAPSDTVVDAVRAITDPVAHCEVLGHIMTQNPGPNRVEWALTLPDEHFLGRYYFIGQGGGAGQIITASADTSSSPGSIVGTQKLLQNGFAVATSDTGHKGGSWDFGVDDPVKRLDYGHRGAHVSAVATQAITRAYYAMSDKLYRYHLGCSGGGRMGMMAALHHPEDYDGIVASTVAKGGGSLEFVPVLQHVVKHPDAWISPQKLAFLEHKVNEKCAGPDGLVRDPYGCGFDVTTVQCKQGDQPTCLTAAEISTVKVITSRFKLGTDEDSDVPGFSISNPTGWSSFLIGPTRPTSTSRDNPWAPAKPPLSYGIVQSIARGFYFNDMKYDVINDLDFKDQKTLELLTKNHPVWAVTTPDLSGYKKAGGKLIMWAPMSENAVPPATEIEYFAGIKKTVPGATDFVALYESPGNFHCGGGIGAQDTPDRLLDTVIAWVEEGKKPGPVIANGGTPRPGMAPGEGMPAPAPVPARTVLLCPVPQKAVFVARKGAFPFDANNWKCE